MPDKKRLLPRLFLSTAICGVAAALVGPALTGPARADDAPTDGKTTPEGVTVADSPGASDRLDKAHEKELQKQWKTAAELYQEALDKYGSRVVQTNLNVERGIYQYSGIAPIVQERIAKWPAEGLTIYRNAYGQTAADLLAAVPRGSTAGLDEIFWNYFATDAGKTAGMRLIDADMERGDFQAAEWIGNRLLTLHPGLGADRGAITYRTAVASHRAGNSKQALALLNQLKQAPAEIGSIGGKDVSLVDSLTAMLATTPPAPTTRPSDADTYPSFGGLGGRGEISTSTARPGASLNSILLTKPEPGTLPKPVFQQQETATINNNLAMGIMPVVDAGALFFQDGRCVYAVDADSGAPLAGWLNTYSGGDRAGRYRLNVSGRVRNEPTTITVTPTAVLAVMGQPDRMSMQGNVINPFMMQGPLAGIPSTVKLVCLDRNTGREMWVKTPAELPEPAAAVRTGSYCGTPVLIPADLTPYGEDCVMVIARGGPENQFDDCYAVCLTLKTGQYKWSTYIGSATRSYDTDPSQASLADGRIFVMTNLGNVAALDPADGRIVWLNSYTRESIMNPEQAMLLNARRLNNGLQIPTTSSSGSWTHNPVFVSDGNVFVLPRDARQLFVYDAASGVEKNRIPMSEYDNAEVLLGVRDGCVCLTSKKQFFAVDWQKYRDGDAESARQWYEENLPGADGSEVCGRGFMTTGSVFIPTKYRLLEVGWKSRRLLHYYPTKGQFSGGQGPGNIIVTAHDVIVAGQSQVDVYTDLGLVRQRFDSAIAAAPTDPAPRMGFADALFAGGDIEGALEHVDQAIDLLGGLNTMRSGPGRQQVFNTMLHYANQFARIKGKDNDADTIAWENKFYDRAAAAAESPGENAGYRLARAQFDHQHADYAGEMQLCQEVLFNDAMRGVVMADDVAAGSLAETAIDIAKNKSNAYAPIEAKAADALKAARETTDPDELLAVATVYPNSKAAADARADAVHRFEADNQPDKAIGILRRMYAGLGERDGGKKADLLVSIANDFLSMPDGLGPALDRLCRAEKISNSVTLQQKLRLADGTELAANTTFVEAVAKLRQMQYDQENAKLPDFHLRVRAPNETNQNLDARALAALNNPFLPAAPGAAPPKIADVMALVHPLREFDRADQILTWGSTGLCIYPAGATTPMATISQVDKAPLGAAWTHDHWLVWTTSDLYQINADGKLGWDFPLTHLPTLLVSAGADALVDDAGESDPDNNNVVIGPNGQVFVNGGGGRVRIQVNGRVNLRGGVAVVQPPPAPPPPAAVAGDEQIAAVQPGGDRVIISTSTGRLLALDFRGGQTLWQTRPLDHAVDQLLVNPHFTVVRMDDAGGSQLAVFDTPTGHIIGRRRYGADNTPTQLVNVALSEEATLAITLYSHAFVKDLYEPWKAAPLALLPQSNPDIAPYVGLSQSDQLIVKGGWVACVYDQGAFARGYDLSMALDPKDPKGTGSTGVNSTAVSLRLIGGRMFIQTPRSVLQYNLKSESDAFEGNIGQQDFIPKVHTVLLGKDDVITINDPVDRGPVGEPFVKLGAFRRTLHPGSTREWGDFDYDPKISSPAGIVDWAGAEGCVYYLSKDNTLHLLRGARP